MADAPKEIYVSFAENTGHMRQWRRKPFDGGALYVRADGSDLAAELQHFVNGVETGAITSDHDETLENVMRRARAALAKVKGDGQ